MNPTLSQRFVIVHDPEAAPAFHSDALGLEQRSEVGKGEFRWTGVGAVSQRVRAAGAEIVEEPTDQPWGRRDFAVRDPSGNLVRIDQPPAPR